MTYPPNGGGYPPPGSQDPNAQSPQSPGGGFQYNPNAQPAGGQGLPPQQPPPQQPPPQQGGYGPPQQPPYGAPPPGYGGYPPQQPQKSNTGLIIGMIALVVVLALGGGVGYLLVSDDGSDSDDSASDSTDGDNTNDDGDDTDDIDDGDGSPAKTAEEFVEDFVSGPVVGIMSGDQGQMSAYTDAICSSAMSDPDMQIDEDPTEDLETESFDVTYKVLSVEDDGTTGTATVELTLSMEMNGTEYDHPVELTIDLAQDDNSWCVEYIE